MRRGSTAATEWMRVRVTATECPRIAAAFLEEERRAMGRRGSSRSICASSWITATAVFGRDRGGGGARRRM